MSLVILCPSTFICEPSLSNLCRLLGIDFFKLYLACAGVFPAFQFFCGGCYQTAGSWGVKSGTCSRGLTLHCVGLFK